MLEYLPPGNVVRPVNFDPAAFDRVHTTRCWDEHFLRATDKNTRPRGHTVRRAVATPVGGKMGV